MFFFLFRRPDIGHVPDPDGGVCRPAVDGVSDHLQAGDGPLRHGVDPDQLAGPGVVGTKIAVRATRYDFVTRKK